MILLPYICPCHRLLFKSFSQQAPLHPPAPKGSKVSVFPKSWELQCGSGWDVSPRAGEKAGGVGRSRAAGSQVGAEAKLEQQRCQTDDPSNLVSRLRQRPAPALQKNGKQFTEVVNEHSFCIQRVSFGRSGVYVWTAWLHLLMYQLRHPCTQLQSLWKQKIRTCIFIVIQQCSKPAGSFSKLQEHPGNYPRYLKSQPVCKWISLEKRGDASHFTPSFHLSHYLRAVAAASSASGSNTAQTHQCCSYSRLHPSNTQAKLCTRLWLKQSTVLLPAVKVCNPVPFQSHLR